MILKLIANIRKSNFVVSLHKVTIAFLLSTAVFGYVLGYKKLYFFHIALSIYWLFVIVGAVGVKKSTIKSLAIFIFLFFYICATLIWAPSFVNGLYFIFYFFCGFSLIFSIVNYVQEKEQIEFIFKVLGLFLILNFSIGFVESLGVFRLPVSPYATGSFPYANYSNIRPSGFNSNLNNFGFVFAIIFPFLFFYPKKIAKPLALALMSWFAYALQSKGFFLSFVFFAGFYFINGIKRKSVLVAFGIVSLFFVIFIILFPKDLNTLSHGRIFSTFDEIEYGLELMGSVNFDARGSTATRAFIYQYGLQELSDSYGLGLGVAGISTLLEFSGSQTTSFHGFFIEMMIDFGVIPFVIMLMSYFLLIYKLLYFSKSVSGRVLSYYCRASAYSLFIALPASIAPSSIIYVLTFWILIGFSVATVRLTSKAENEKIYSF